MFRALGEEPHARRVARAIVRARAKHALSTTGQLAGLVERTVGRHGAHHPATRVFQALRMAVNDELGELERALDGALSLLRVGGRMAVISFESITDRVVKRFFADHAGRMVSLQQGGARWEGRLPRMRLVTRHAVKADDDERGRNPRARSAKLRVAERV
jgi:16S rRNA (cytosine1402-N4)-methyltransferase